MRRIFSILFILLFGLGPLAAAMGPGDDASLPACCRRLGAHHCAMASHSPSKAIQDSHSLELRAPSRCPLFPLHGNASPSPIALSKRSQLPLLSLIGGTQGLWSSSTFPDRIHLRTPALRGPPPSLLA